MKIAVNNPSILLTTDTSRLFHGYGLYFVLKYCDYIYVQNEDRILEFKRRLKEINPDREISFIRTIEELNEKSEVLVSLSIPTKSTYGIENYNGMVVIHSTDHHVDASHNYKMLKECGANYVIGHSQLDSRSEFFCNYYPGFIGKVISVPFGYAPRFKCYTPFSDRKNKAVGIGSINMIKDAMLSEQQSKDMVTYFNSQKWMHPFRKYVQDHEDELLDCIDSLFPSPSKQKDFGYDAVSLMNQYKMFINDAGIQEFPPARTFEGIACGCVMVADDDPIYEDIGFKQDYNYISYTKGVYEEAIDKIRFYIKNEKKLEELQKKSIDLSTEFTQEKMADLMYAKILERYDESRKSSERK